MNVLVLNETRVGIVFRDKDKIAASISSFNERTDTKQKYIELKNALK